MKKHVSTVCYCLSNVDVRNYSNWSYSNKEVNLLDVK